jgi:hypothetical protein
VSHCLIFPQARSVTNLSSSLDVIGGYTRCDVDFAIRDVLINLGSVIGQSTMAEAAMAFMGD